ncbi:YggS family pyridoxal phosphate-dependent enzyme [Bacteroidales bacterium OttesenSCG-928-B11]|nr:YggS family pyridoxal phosphate-dependent enzyme [Bacteroidales bacterium OttesenSCG-928-E04]MDL2311979.1 YggS family pyridoxal phosphate-dependent enzyme [Bacteroidales bacterium OttesenSCG-928-B11]MDL2326831.1 YggS family pyridoxal phosphate-dependent enzyme [Bacteroidales bacterium OttesenSCG-928-A14]
MNIENYNAILTSLPTSVLLVAVSKTKPNEDIQTLYNEGQRIFGENKAQELRTKYEMLPKDIEWHFIGHLQSNKIKYIAPFIAMIHSVDSLKLLQEINKLALKYDRVIPCLLQFHIAKEESKFGFDWVECEAMLQDPDFWALKNVEIAGVMGMATLTDDENQIRSEFQLLKNHFDRLKAGYFPDNANFKEISMGMTDDYQIAIEEGSTLVRIGSAIFGER